MSPTTKELVGWGIILFSIALVIFTIIVSTQLWLIIKVLIPSAFGLTIGIRMLKNARAGEEDNG